MASGTWKIFVPTTNTYVTLDKSNPVHQALLLAKTVTLRDDGFSGNSTQDTDVMPFSGEGFCIAAPVDVVTYSAGSIAPVICDPDTVGGGGDSCLWPQGAGSNSIVGVITTVNTTAKSSILWGVIPPNVKWRAFTITGAGTMGLLVVFTRAGR